MATKKKPVIDMTEDSNQPSDVSMKQLVEMIDEVISLQTSLAELEEACDNIKKSITDLTDMRIPTYMDQIGVAETTLTDGTKVITETQVYPSISKDDFPAAYAWFKKNKLDDMVKSEVKVNFGRGEQEKAKVLSAFLKQHKIVDFAGKTYVHPQTLGAFVRERLREGAELPPSISINPVRKTVIKPPKKEK